MAGRAATAVKSKSEPRAKATTARAKTAKTTTKTVAEKSPPAPKTRKKKAETRTRIYWAVYDQNLKRVAVFEFNQKAEAEKRVEKLSVSGGHHFINKIKVAV